MRLFPSMLVFVLLPVLITCSNGEDDPVPGPAAIASPEATVTVPPEERRTGIPLVDGVIDILEAGDEAAFRARLNAFPERCSTNPQGLGDPPRCEAGVADGGTIQTIRLIACHRSYPGDDDNNLLAGALPWKRALYAVFESVGVDLFQFVPRGDYALVFTNEKGGSERYEVTRDGRVNGVWFSCGQAQEVLPKMLQDALGYVVPPRYALPTPTPTPRPTSRGYPPGYDTGIIGVNVVAGAIESGDPGRISAHFQLHPIGCIVEPVGIPSPPFCKDGQPAGTPVLVMPVSSCEGEYWEQSELSRLFENDRFEGRLFAAYSRTLSWYKDIPEPTHTLILRRDDGAGFEVHILGGLIIGVFWGCGATAEDLAKLVPAGRMVLPPP